MAHRSQRTTIEKGTKLRETERPAWSPAQVVAVIIGLMFIVLGGVGLARSGTRFSDIPLARASIAGLHVTALSAAALIALGLVLLIGGARPTSAKATMATMGAISLAFGLIVAIDPTRWFNMWAFSRDNGVFLAAAGAVMMLAAALSPIFVARRQVLARESEVVDDRPAVMTN